MQKYVDRYAAGKTLAKELQSYSNCPDVIILALPRGGVPVAFEIAQSLSVPLDLFIVRKLGAPQHEEVAVGALAAGGVTFFNQELIQNLAISQDTLNSIIKKESQELQRREIAYRDNKPFPLIKNLTVILVDDGVATGATLYAAIKALRALSPANIIVAVPVAQITTCEKIETLVDKLVCPLKTNEFYSVGQYYDDFSQTTDDEVRSLLKQVKTK